MTPGGDDCNHHHPRRGDDPPGGGDDPPPARPPSLPRQMLGTAFGIVYDLRHWGQLPPRRRGGGALATWTWVLTRGGRFPYLLLWVTSLCLVVLLVACLCAVRRRPAPPLGLGLGAAAFRYG